MPTAITNARIFDGVSVVSDANTVVIDGGIITAISNDIPVGATVIDASGATLIPGLIDAHAHTKIPQLRLALTFGVTTELEMMGYWTPEQRKEVAERDDIADLKTAGFGVAAPGGHPSELHGPRGGGKPSGGKPSGAGPPGGAGGPPIGHPGHGHKHDMSLMKTVTNSEEAVRFVQQRVDGGADYIKVMIEEGTVLNAPGLPMLSHETLTTAVNEAHKHGKLAIAHVLTAEATEQALSIGIDGLAHVFLDKPASPELVAAIAKSGVFVTPCLVLNSSIMGHTGAEFAKDPRVSSKLSAEWHETLCSSFNTYRQGNFSIVLDTVYALHKAGVDILVGTDASVPQKHLGGLAHGASVHHEMQMLVQAGFTPIEALRAATSVPAKRFGMDDRGCIEVGRRADLVLVGGDVLEEIGNSLEIEKVWRRGVEVDMRGDL